MSDFDRESMLEMFVYEINQLMVSLEQIVLETEKGMTEDHINEIFRIMHTVKGSSAMMLYDGMEETAHAVEDMFYFLREEKPKEIDYTEITDLVLEGMDFIKEELDGVSAGVVYVKRDNKKIIEKINEVLSKLKNEEQKVEVLEKPTKIKIETFEKDVNLNTIVARFKLLEDCQMKTIRSYTIFSNFTKAFESVISNPENLLDEGAEKIIEEFGFSLIIKTNEELDTFLKEISKTSYVHSVSLVYDKKGKEEKSIKLNKYLLCVEKVNDLEENIASIQKIINFLQKNVDSLEIMSLNIENKEEGDLNFIITTDKTDYVLKDELSSVITSNNFYLDENLDVREITQLSDDDETETKKEIEEEVVTSSKKTVAPQVISVSVSKLDSLLNLIGELVISEAMVTQNPDLDDLEIPNFRKNARQLHKIINDVQDLVMGMRMVPVSVAFNKMHRIVRDMSRQLEKDVHLEIIGEETEVDKNIIEHISDPLMHMIRNSIDHGLEPAEERLNENKDEFGTVTLEAKNAGGDVLIIIKDNGRGLDVSKILEKAKKNGLLNRPESEYTDKEIQNFIFQPGFSTNEVVTTFSGRGVGMDVVTNNLQMIGGSVEVSSVAGEGSEFTLKIPLTLAIIEGMIIRVGQGKYTIPIVSIRQSFKATSNQVTVDPEGNEMISVRGEVLDLIRLHDFFDIDHTYTNIEDGIVIIIENGKRSICLFADEIIGEYQVVVKTIPKYIKKTRGLSGCTLLGNGDISLIIDTVGFFNS